MSNSCDFCGQIAGDPERNRLLPLLGTSWSRQPLLAARHSAVVMPSVGALVEGHVLVCPREHVRSIAAASTEAAADVEALATETRQKLEDRTALPVHSFEHGSGSDGTRVACSIEHAHLHILPAEVEIRPRLRQLCEWQPLEGGIEPVRAAAEGREYLLYEAPDGERWLARTEIGFPSQLLRQVFSETLGRGDEWNWREHAARSEVEATVALFASAYVGA